jgi:tRNA pseudouridine32 synthase/23S rRNA pseudouridine746 synthase
MRSIVHRLDMATSGLVVMARSLDMQRALSAAFADRQVHKRYEAIVDGAMPVREDWSIIDAPLMADWPRRPLQKTDPAGKPSLTRWRALASSVQGDSSATHVLLEPETGPLAPAARAPAVDRSSDPGRCVVWRCRGAGACAAPAAACERAGLRASGDAAALRFESPSGFSLSRP